TRAGRAPGLGQGRERGADRDHGGPQPAGPADVRGGRPRGPPAAPDRLRAHPPGAPEGGRPPAAAATGGGSAPARGGGEAGVIVAIDGGVASGKSAVGRRVAEALGLPFVDTGLMYRAVALAALERGVEVGDGAALTALAAGLKVRTEGRRVWVDAEEVTDRVYEARISEV